MFELTSDEKKALDWALNQNLGSVAAQYSKILAIALKRAMKEIEPVTGEYLCVVCHKVPVDVLSGYDTCSDCASRI